MSINQNKTSNRNFFMKLALKQAQRNLGNTRENPSVGCVITKNNNLISAGSTSINGRPHAEVNAINSSKITLNDSELYVSLEPCTHYGKTPPCVNLITKKNINKVFFSIKDPDIRTYNKSIKFFKNKGIYVNYGLLKDETKSFYRSYFKFKKNKLPFVTYKLAISRDYFIVNKKDKYITNEFSRGRVHLMRYNHDCIITSSKSIISDNSKLTCRIDGLICRSPARIILDKKLKIPLSSNIIKQANKFNTIIFYNKKNYKIKILRKLKVKLIKMPIDDEKNLDLEKVLIKTRKLGFSRILLECGAKLGKNFLKKNLIDDFKLFKSNKNLGKNGNYNVSKILKSIIYSKKFEKEKVNLFGDKLFSYRLK